MRCGIVCWAVAVVAMGATAHAEGERPNVVVIMLDDLGFGDLGCYGGEIRTPNIDRLAAGGWRFSRFYNASRCCPTRASLLTGMYPHQVGLARNGRDLSHDAATVAELLRAGGYQTAMVGKWHLSQTTPLGGKGNGAEHFAWLNHQADHDRPFAKLDDLSDQSWIRSALRHDLGRGRLFRPVFTRRRDATGQGRAGGFLLHRRHHREIRRIDPGDVEARRGRSFCTSPIAPRTGRCMPGRRISHGTARRTATAGTRLRESRYQRQVDMKLIDPATHPLPPLMGRGPDWDALERRTARPSSPP